MAHSPITWQTWHSGLQRCFPLYCLMMKSPNTERGLGPMLLLSNGLEGNAENTGVYILFENSYTFHNFSLNLLRTKYFALLATSFGRLEVRRVEKLEGQRVERMDGWLEGQKLGGWGGQNVGI